jgi:hypothetical protein
VVERLNISCSSALSSRKEESSKEQKEPVGRNIATPPAGEKPIVLKKQDARGDSRLLASRREGVIPTFKCRRPGYPARLAA